MRERAEKPLEDPQARLELALMDEYLAGSGCSLSTVDQRPPAERQVLLRQATSYAAVRLAEIDARAAYVHQVHGGATRT